MINNKTIAVVVPAYNEESQVGMVLESIPSFVDRIIVVDDNSKDRTSDVVKEYIDNPDCNFFTNEFENKLVNGFKDNIYNYADRIVHEQNLLEKKYLAKSKVFNTNNQDRIILINHLENSGVGAAISTGYKWCKDHGVDCTAVMAGDGQMDPSELRSICMPVIQEGIDYVKGNRLIHRSAWLVIPKVRYFGNSILSILTKLASGYWHISDTQTGYTAISKKALNAIRIYDIYKSYGMPNDLLVKLNIAFCTLKEVEIKPVYKVGEQSKMKILKVIPRVSWLLLKAFFKRLWIKYLFRDFHPLFLLYHFSFLLFIVWIPFLTKVSVNILTSYENSFETLFAFTFLGISAFQAFLFAMWMDIQDNNKLQK